LPPLIVLDTGVVIRALIGSTEASSYRMVRLAATGDIRLAHSDEGLRELTRVVGEKDEEGLVRSASKAFGVAMDLWTHGTLSHPTRRDWPSIPDPDDGWMLDLAFEATADYIVSWDPHLTYSTMPFPVEVKTPSVFLWDIDHGNIVDAP
jgi:putative PIN family toxin of toxin-antitoxin system